MIMDASVLTALKGCPYFITGSRRFGSAKADSDVDVVILTSDKNKIIKALDKPTKSSEYNNGLKLWVGGTEYNFIPLHPLDFVAWYHAANLVLKTPLISKCSRPELHGLHEMYIGLVKRQFASAGDIVTVANCLKHCEGLK